MNEIIQFSFKLNTTVLLAKWIFGNIIFWLQMEVKERWQAFNNKIFKIMFTINIFCFYVESLKLNINVCIFVFIRLDLFETKGGVHIESQETTYNNCFQVVLTIK